MLIFNRRLQQSINIFQCIQGTLLFTLSVPEIEKNLRLVLVASERM